MKRLRVEFQTSARDDLTDIFEYILLKSSSEAIAEGYVGRLLAACTRIGMAPEAGRPRGDLEPGLRTWSFERRATIAYRIVGDAVQVARIFYGGRDSEMPFRLVSRD